MLKSSVLPAAALAATLLGGCSAAGPADVAAPSSADDAHNLRAALAGLGPAAAACAAAPPSGYAPAGLELLAAHAPAWLAAIPAPVAESSPAADAAGGGDAAPVAATASQSPGAEAGCDPDALERDLRRTQTLAARLAASSQVATAIARAASADEAIIFGTLPDDAEPPPVEDLAALDQPALSDLAAAEDQAGFLGEYLAAQLAEGPERERLIASAARHRQRGQTLATMAGGDDPRAAAYQLGERPADAAAVHARWAAAELALASHYAALPVNSGVELAVRWQLVEAAAWGAALPALPFHE